jgi:hypothetical protein
LGEVPDTGLRLLGAWCVDRAGDDRRSTIVEDVVATVAFLVTDEHADLTLGPAVAEQLVRLGISDVALFRDRETVCVVLDGWAFDPTQSGEAAAAALGGGVRVLHPVMRSALQPVTQET